MRKDRFIVWMMAVWLLVGANLVRANEVGNKINKLISNKTNQKVRFSICFKDLEDGRDVYKFNADRPQKPASNMKIITTAAAVDILGGDFQYDTFYGLLGDDLVVIASGDPLMGDPVLAEKRGQNIYQVFDVLGAKLKKLGLETIKGDLVIDDSIFDSNRFHKSWDPDQANRWYAAQVSGLSFNDNCIDILFWPSIIGKVANYGLEPDTKFIDITNKCKTVSRGGTKVGALRGINNNKVTLIGQCQKKLVKPIYLAIDQPSAFHGYVLAERLQKKFGIKIQGKLLVKKVTDSQHKAPEGFKPLLIHQTKLTTVLDQCNQRSLNLAAEALFKTIGTREAKANSKKIIDQGSWVSGRENIEKFLERLGIGQEQFKIDDGSGLSHNNKISARAMTTLLGFMFEHENADLYRNSMSTPGVGTLSKRGRFRGYEGRIFAKTGYINGVNSLSGYCKNKAGKWLAFSVITNSPSATNSTIDQIVTYCMDN